jgi:hypothetical protein
MTRELVDALHTWAKHNSIAGNLEDAELVLELLLDHVVDDPGELEPGDLDELLLEIYPSLVTVLAPTELGDVVPSTRDLVAFLVATGRIRPELVDPLRRELDAVEPDFVDAVMDPGNWGPTRTLTQAMVVAGADITDEAQVERWMNEHDLDEDGEPGLAETLGLPDRLPALRLPSDPELAAAARDSGLLRQASELARWVGDGRAVVADELEPADAHAAADALGIAQPDLTRLWDVAVTAGLVTIESDSAQGNPDDGGDDGDALDRWALAFDATVAVLDLDAHLAGEEQLDFEGAGAVCLSLFLERATGISRAELSELLHGDATDGLDPETADPAWRAWVEAHGDPTDLLLARLAAHDAVRFSDEVVHLTPLGLWVMWQQLTDGGIDIPLLPPTDEMTAVDLVAAAEGLPEEALDEEVQAWLASRAPESAANELLDLAAAGDPLERLFAVAVTNRLGGRAESRWRVALDQPELRAYAKVALPELAGTEGSDVEPLTVADLAWLVTDLLAATGPEDDLEVEVRAAVPSGTEYEVIDLMWRIDHPQAADVLTMLGEGHPDRKLAKAARKAAFKARSRQG